MRRVYALGFCVALGLLAITAADGATGVVAPQLAVTTDVNGNTILSYDQSSTADAVQSIAIYVPTPYTSNFGFNDADTVGTATATGAAADQGGATVSLSGSIAFAAAGTNTVTYGGTTTTLNALATACTGSAAKSAFMLMNLSGGGQTLQIPFYDDIIVTGTQYSDTSIHRLMFCLPAPDLAAGAAGRSPVGLKLTSIQLVLQGVFGPPPGWYMWHTMVAPYAAGTGKSDASKAFEVDSLDRTPQEVALSVTADPKTRALIAHGQVKQGGKGVSGASVEMFGGKRSIGKATTKAGGFFKTVVKTTAATAHATATLAARPLPSCTQPIFAPFPCVTATAGGFTVSSDPVPVKR